MHITVRRVREVWYNHRDKTFRVDEFIFTIPYGSDVSLSHEPEGDLGDSIHAPSDIRVYGDYRHTELYRKNNLELIRKMKEAGLEIEGPAPEDKFPQLGIQFPQGTRITDANYDMPKRKKRLLERLI